jgi:hypothetical protein
LQTLVQGGEDGFAGGGHGSTKVSGRFETPAGNFCRCVLE